MKITLILSGCLTAALLLALSAYHQTVDTSPHRTSEALADAMSSHGIELGEPDADVDTASVATASTAAANFKVVAYRQSGRP